MFCKHCGANLPDGVKFCPACGKPTVKPGAGSNPPINNGASPTGGTVHPFPGTTNSEIHGTSENKSRGTSFIPSSSGFHAAGSKVKKTFNIGNFILWGGCAVAILSLFLPYCSASFLGFTQSISLIDVETGMYFLVIIGIIAVLNFFKLNILCIVGSVFNLMLALYGRSYVQEEAGGLVNFEIGNTLLFLGSVAMLAASVASLILWNKAKKSA